MDPRLLMNVKPSGEGLQNAKPNYEGAQNALAPVRLFADIRARVEKANEESDFLKSKAPNLHSFMVELPKLLEAIDVMQKCLEFYARAGGLEATGTLERVRKLSEGEK